MQNALISILLAIILGLFMPSAQAKSTQAKIDDKIALDSFYISKKYAKNIALKVDLLVKDNFFDKNIAGKNWINSYKLNKEKILSSTNLKELTDSINKCLSSLKTSHCRLVSVNDETYHFLHSLFATYSDKKDPYRGEKLFVGFVTGGNNLKDNEVRFVLNDSPAAKSGIKNGDQIVSVNGKKYYGYANFIGSKNKVHQVLLSRDSKLIKVNLKAEPLDVYTGYTKSTKNSSSIFKLKGKNLGYFHLWTGGNGCHDALNDEIEDTLANTDGLILDLRDGYGANDLVDLDRFYRKKENYPDIKSISRDGKINVYRCYYDKPIVAIINGGARSGKELITYSLKKSGRAITIGSKTSGSVVAGKLFKIDKFCSLYLAINDVLIDGKRLEGRGVEPVIEVKFSLDKYRKGIDTQLEEAKEILFRKIIESK